jgi:serine/threonine protein kinase
MTATELQTGSTFAGYRIDAEIGRGGMGVVYRARDLSLERPVALKLITPELASDEGFRKRFLKESRLAASLDHPHVLPVFAAGEEAGQLYLATRYVEGEDLRTLLRREGKVSPERALRICGQVAEALDAAHRRGLVHRDVKPANVLLDESGEAYLADFGLTKQVGGAVDGDGAARRHPRLPRPRADPRRGGRRAHGRVRARLRPVRVPRGAGALPPLDGSRASVGAHAGACARALPPIRASTPSSPARSPRRRTTATKARPPSATPPPRRSAWRPRVFAAGAGSYAGAASCSPPGCSCWRGRQWRSGWR